jgi:hypothetical protein
LGGVVLDEIRKRLAKVIDVRCTSPQYFGCAGIVEQRQQEMLYGDEFVALLAGLYKGHVQADFKFLGNHVVSFWLATVV